MHVCRHPDVALLLGENTRSHCPQMSPPPPEASSLHFHFPSLMLSTVCLPCRGASQVHVSLCSRTSPVVAGTAVCVMVSSPVALCPISTRRNHMEAGGARPSRPMTEMERRYAQIEKEVFTTWACEKFYVLGPKFLIESDHKPLIPLLNMVYHT